LRKQKRRGHNEGSIFQRSDGRWSASLTLEGGKRKTYYGHTRKEVADKLRVAQHEQQQGTLITGPQQTLGSFLEEWLAMKQGVLKGGTLQNVRYNIENHILPALGHIRLHKLSPEHIQKFYGDLGKTLSANTIHKNIHRILHNALALAVKWKKIATNPCDVVEPPKVSHQEMQVLNSEQVQRLIGASQSHWMVATLIPLAVTTGMRHGEILALAWNDVDVETRNIKITKSLSWHKDETGKFHYFIESPKTKSSIRTIPLPDMLEPLLSAHRIEQVKRRLAAPSWPHPELVFPNSVGNYFHHHNLANTFNAVLEEAGLPHIRFHDLRHTAATQLLSMGVHPKVVAEWLGHSSTKMTMDIYSHVLPSMLDDARDILNEMYSKKAEG